MPKRPENWLHRAEAVMVGAAFVVLLIAYLWKQFGGN